MTITVEKKLLVSTRTLGDGEYSPADDNVAWPASPKIWYLNKFLQITSANIVFALFCEGLLKVCDKLANPMSLDETSFSERVYGKFVILLLVKVSS